MNLELYKRRALFCKPCTVSLGARPGGLFKTVGEGEGPTIVKQINEAHVIEIYLPIRITL